MYIIFYLLWVYDVSNELVFISRVYRARLYTVFDRIFDFDWRVTEGGGVRGAPKAALAQGPAKGLMRHCM